MKNSMKLKTIASLLVMIMLLTIANISRAYSVGADLTTSDKLKGGQEVKVTLSFKGIDALDGLRSGSIENIVYDPNIFEEITDDSFEGQNRWSTAYSKGKLVITKSNPMTNDGAVVALTLKVKEGADTTKPTTVQFNGIVVASGSVATGGTGNITVENQAVEIPIDKNADSGLDDSKTNSLAPTNETPAPTQNEAKQNVAPKANNTSNKIASSKTTSKKLPKAGDAATIAIMAIVALAIVAGIVGYVKYSKNKDIK